MVGAGLDLGAYRRHANLFALGQRWQSPRPETRNTLVANGGSLNRRFRRAWSFGIEVWGYGEPCMGITAAGV